MVWKQLKLAFHIFKNFKIRMNKKRLAYLIIILIGVLLYGMSAFFGFSYFDGQLEKAEKQYNQALDLNPLEPMAHNNLGVIYRDYGNFDMAEDEFLAELELKHSSSYYLAQDNLDYLLILKNKLR